MWSFGVYNLRLSDREFWNLTLAQFDALVRRYKDEQRRSDYRSAMICSILAEINRDRKRRTKPFSPEDFMPKEEETKRIDNPKMKRALERISQMLEGKEE